MPAPAKNKLNLGMAKLALIGFGMAMIAGVAGAYVAGAREQAEIEQMVASYIAKNGAKLRESIETSDRLANMIDTTGLVTADTPIHGQANAEVTIIEFGDFECPFCSRVQTTLDKLETKYGTKLNFAFKQLPLDFHTNAEPAAAASIAAHKQGRFVDFTNVLWANQSNLGEDLYLATAQKLGLDIAKFNADRKSESIKQQIEADKADAARIGARGTPFFIINGTPLSGAESFDTFSAVIDWHLARAK